MTDPTTPLLFTCASDVAPASSMVAGFVGREALSELYNFRIGILTTDEEIDLAAARGMAATLHIHDGGPDDFAFHGMIARASLLHAWADQALYELVVVPKVWALTLTHYSRVFVDMSVVEIIEELLAASGLSDDDYQLVIQGDHAPHDHICQYKESRWSFLSRLMERDGLYYFFEQGDNAEKLIITDNVGAHRAFRQEAITYQPLDGAQTAMAEAAFHHFMSEHRAIAREVLVRDFDPLNPNLDVQGEGTGWHNSAAAQAHHGDHDVRTPDAAAGAAEIMAERWRTEALRFRGSGPVFGLRSGYRFSLAGHPLQSLNTPYLATSVRHSGNQISSSARVRKLLGIEHAQTYLAEVEALDAGTQFRPATQTPVPRISGVERGFIDGPADSDYAQIDEHGRYKVKLHFDIDDSEQWDGEASTWIRMLQPHGGTVEGFHFPLRKNTEVLIIFLGGNPDRPVIAGAVPNALQPSPVTSDNQTQNVLQTGGANRIEFEDQEGCRYIDISTPPKDTWIHLGVPHREHTHFMTFHTDGNQLVQIGGNRDISVGGPQNEDVKGTVSETYDANHNSTIAGDRNLTVGGCWNISAAGGTILNTPKWTNEVSGATSIQTGTLNIAAGSTNLVFGDTNLNWGATNVGIASLQGIIGSIALTVPGGVEIVTPSFKTINPSRIDTAASWYDTVGFECKAVGFSMQATGASVSATGAKVDLHGISLQNLGARIYKSGAKADVSAGEAKGSAWFSGWSGLWKFG